jgi:hypothetical protein
LAFVWKELSFTSLQSLKKTFCFCSWTSTFLFLIDIIFFSYLFLSFFFLSLFSVQPLLDLARGIYKVLGGHEFIFDILILRRVLWILDKYPLKSLCMWTYENQIVFCMILAMSGFTKLPTFEASSKQFWHHHRLRPSKFGRGTPFIRIHIYLIWRFVTSYSFVQKCQPNQPQI